MMTPESLTDASGDHFIVSSGDGNSVLCGAEPAGFVAMRADLVDRLLETEPKNYGKWQQIDISESDAHATYELQNVTIWYDMPLSRFGAREYIKPDVKWAEGHFQERVAGEAVNPGEWHDRWPYHAGQVKLHQNGGKYDHNYMERFWPTKLRTQVTEFFTTRFMGYRFPVGDLNDVVQQLVENPGTRQAYLPIFFPEDTGATKGQRVPCTLGYHFLIRDGKLHLQYNLRSCEAYRHFTNDVYMAVRLAQWVCDQLNARPELGVEYEVGQLTMNIVSFHGFKGDDRELDRLANYAD